MESIKLSEEDRQAVEIISLKIANLDLQRRVLMQDTARANEMIGKLQAELTAKSEVINKKYGIILGQDIVNADGTVIRASGTLAQNGTPVVGAPAPTQA